MARKNHRPEQIIKKLQQAEILLDQSSTVGEASSRIGDLLPLAKRIRWDEV